MNIFFFSEKWILIIFLIHSEPFFFKSLLGNVDNKVKTNRKNKTDPMIIDVVFEKMTIQINFSGDKKQFKTNWITTREIQKMMWISHDHYKEFLLYVYHSENKK